MLEIEDLVAGYGATMVIHGLSLSVRAGGVTVMLGANGAGKTTLMKTLAGLVQPAAGRFRFMGEDITGSSSDRRVTAGMVLVPEGRMVFPSLSVRENLRLGLIAGKHRHTERDRFAEIAQTFPRLAERMDQDGTSMSGGEQQMLAIARALMAKPRMILLDEPSEGIMPLLVHEMFELFQRLKRDGTTILLVEQNVERALQISDRAYIVDQGRIVHQGDAQALLDDREIQERYCAV